MIKQLSSIIITMLLFLNSTILIIQTSSSLSDDEIQRDIEKTQKETEQLKKCMDADYKLDFCDKSSLIN